MCARGAAAGRPAESWWEGRVGRAVGSACDRLYAHFSGSASPRGPRILRDVLGLPGRGLGGEGGIRTHDTLARIPVFETGTFNRSVTSPLARILPARSMRRFDGLDLPHVGP